MSKRFPSAAGTFTALNEVSLSILSGEFVAVIGKSGSGKSTLLENVMLPMDFCAALAGVHFEVNDRAL